MKEAKSGDERLSRPTAWNYTSRRLLEDLAGLLNGEIARAENPIAWFGSRRHEGRVNV